jgi:monoamine oxidase
MRSTAGGMLARARAVSAVARRTGADVEEAAAMLDSAAAGITRREALERAGLAAAALTLPVAFTARGARGGPHDRRVVIVGSGMAGLGSALRLQRHGIASEVYEANAERAGGRIQTLRGFFADGQYTEQHAEFISSEHTATRRLAAAYGLDLDNVDVYPPHTHPNAYLLRFGGRFWPQSELDREWHEWGWRLFRRAANVDAPWPTTYRRHSRQAWAWDHQSAAEWIERHIPGGLRSNFGRLCVAIMLDEYGGPVEQTSALNLVYLLGFDDSSASGLQPKGSPQLSGTDEKWHVRGGNDLLVSETIRRLPAGTVRLGERLEAVTRTAAGHVCTFASAGGGRRNVRADHVVLALPFTKLREVALRGIDLPARQRRAIDEEPLGSNSKIQIQCSSRVWNADGFTANMYTDGIVQGGWEATVDQPGRAGVLIALPGGVGGADIGRRYGLTRDAGPAPQAMVDDYLADFDRNFPGTRAAYNGRAYYTWSSGDPNVGGAYSYLKVGQFTAFNGIQGRRSGNVHFAGEHTSVDFQGFVEGALRSGYRCAREIAGS